MAQLEAFYQAVVEEDVERFAYGPDYALALRVFLESFPRPGPPRPRWLKGQVTGPFSFAMTVTDENKRVPGLQLPSCRRWRCRAWR